MLTFTELLIVIKVPCSVNSQIFQYRRFRTNGDVEILVISDRGNRNCHLPTVHLPCNAHAKHGHLFGIKIKETICAEVPLWRQVKAIVER